MEEGYNQPKPVSLDEMFMDSSPIPSMSTYSNSMNQVFEGGGQTISHRPLSQQRYLSENTFAYRNPALPRIDDMHMNSFGYSLPYQSLNDPTPSSRIHDQFYSGTPLTMNHLSFHSEEMPQYNRFLRQPDDQFPSFDDSTRYLLLPRDPDSSSSVLSYPPPSLSPSFSKPYSVGAQDFSTVNGSVSHSHSAYSGSPYAVSYQETCLTPSLDTDTLVSSSTPAIAEYTPKEGSPNAKEHVKTTSSKGGRRSKKNKVKKNAEQYVINPEKVAANEDTRQFLMIRNIPNSISQEKLLAILETYVRFEIEFLYLPLDKTTSCNLGYGYVSLVNSASVLKLYNAMHMKRWPNSSSLKLCEIVYARIQGHRDYVKMCDRWEIMNDSPKYHPIFFKRVDVEENGVKKVRMVRSSFEELRKRHL